MQGCFTGLKDGKWKKKKNWLMGVRARGVENGSSWPHQNIHHWFSFKGFPESQAFAEFVTRSIAASRLNLPHDRHQQRSAALLCKRSSSSLGEGNQGGIKGVWKWWDRWWPKASQQYNRGKQMWEGEGRWNPRGGKKRSVTVTQMQDARLNNTGRKQSTKT